jgi:hypothetical protein
VQIFSVVAGQVPGWVSGKDYLRLLDSSFSVLWWSSCLPLDRLKPGRERWFIKAIKIRSPTSFGGEVKPSVPFKIFYGVLKILWGVIEIPIGNIQRPFLAQFFPASLLDVSAATRAENSGGWFMNDKNSDRKHNISVNGRSYIGRFVRYHPVTITTNKFSVFPFLSVTQKRGYVLSNLSEVRPL